MGHNAIGVDINGLAILLSKVKATPLSEEEIARAREFIEIISKECTLWGRSRPEIAIRQINGLQHWFQKNVAEELTHLLNEMAKINGDNERDFFKIVLSSIIVRVSNQESDTRYAAINKNIPDNFTFNLFLSRANEYLQYIVEYSHKIAGHGYLKLLNADSRKLSMLGDKTIDFIITSPPYANTYDYYLYHKFRERWLDLDVRFAQYNEIGSRREYSSLKRPASQWAIDLKKCFVEMYRLLKGGGMAFVVIGDSVIQKQLIKMDEVITAFMPDVGFEICNIITSDLSEHSRIFNPTFAQKNKKEHLIILKK